MLASRFSGCIQDIWARMIGSIGYSCTNGRVQCYPEVHPDELATLSEVEEENGLMPVRCDDSGGWPLTGGTASEKPGCDWRLRGAEPVAVRFNDSPALPRQIALPKRSEDFQGSLSRS